MVVYGQRTNHIIPFEQTTSLKETFAAIGVITGGRRINLMELKNVRLSEIGLRINNLVADGTMGTAQITVKVFAIGKIAGATDVVVLSSGIDTNGATKVTGQTAADGVDRRFDSVIIGIELSGGTASRGITINADVYAVATAKGPEFVMPIGGADSFAKAGTSLVFDATTTNYTVTLEAQQTALS